MISIPWSTDPSLKWVQMQRFEYKHRSRYMRTTSADGRHARGVGSYTGTL